MTWHHLIQGFRELVFPSVCAFCGTVTPGSAQYFCSNCTLNLTTDSHQTCPRCSSSIGQFTHLEHGCPRCRDETFHFDEALRLGEYDGTLREAILRIKSTNETLAECLGHLWAERDQHRFRQVGAQIVMPIPLHWKRRWQRGYNQSASLAEAIAGCLKLPHFPFGLKRLRHTPPRSTLSATERRQSLTGAFQVRRGLDLKGKTILLIDDVLTTGATASAAAKALKDSGVQRVVVAVLAHR